MGASEWGRDDTAAAGSLPMVAQAGGPRVSSEVTNRRGLPPTPMDAGRAAG